jgi:hypothetical protein
VALALVLFAFVAGGAFALDSQLDGTARAAFWVPLLAFAALRLMPDEGSRRLRRAAIVLGAIVIPVFALLGFDWLWAKLTSDRLGPLVSLGAGALIVGCAAAVYLAEPWTTRPIRHRRRWAIVVPVVLVLVPPFVFAAVGAVVGSERTLSQPPEVVSKLDVVVLRDGAEPLDLGKDDLDGWKVRTWVGRAGGAGRKVRGAHTLGFNNTSTGVSVIGNFESGPAPRAVLAAIARVAAWKLDRNDGNPSGSVRVTSQGSDLYPAGARPRLPVIDGHRDTNQTACPGRFLYDQLPGIRRRTQRRMDRF